MLQRQGMPTPGKRPWQLGLLLSLLVILGLVFGLRSLVRYEQAWQPDYAQVRTGVVTKQTLVAQLNVTGILDAENKSVVTSPLPGTVANMAVKEGSEVKKGDVLFTLDQKDLLVQLAQAQFGMDKARAAAEQAKIAYDNAQTAYDRSLRLYQAGALSQQQLEQVQMQRDVAKSQYDTALLVGLPSAQAGVQAVQLSLAKTTVMSPIDGVVAACSIAAGDNVGPGVPLLTVVSARTLTLTGTVPEEALTNLHAGQSAQVSVDSFPGATFPARIALISPESIPTGQMFPVRLTLGNADPRLKPGMTASASIQVELDGTLALPNGAVFHRDGQDCVYVIRNGQAFKQAVDTGLKNERFTQVVSGLKEGDQVVISRADLVYEGMKIPAGQ